MKTLLMLLVLVVSCLAGMKTDSLRVGTTTNIFIVEKDGTPTLNGNGTCWEDANMGAVSLGAGASAPDLIAINGGTVFARAFDGASTTEQLFGVIEIPHAAMLNDSVYFHVHWAPITSVAGKVKWQLTYMMRGPGDNIGSETTISISDTTDSAGYRQRLATFPGINHSKLGNQLEFRLFRNPTDGADTYADDAVLFSAGIHYKLDMVGSRTIDTK